MITAIIVLAVLMAIVWGEPLFVVLGAVTVLGFCLVAPDVHSVQDLMQIIEKIRDLADKEVLLAIPFFVIAGAIMTRGQISARLIDVAKALVGWLPGGLAVATVLACGFFAAISGSSPATVIAIGSVMVPALLKDRYQENFSLGLVTTSGSLGILIPPSIPMIVYALVKTSGEKIDVGELFLAGLGPGVLICGMLVGYSIVCGIRFGVPPQPFSMKRLIQACRDGIWALSLPLLILGGIYSGLFTPTEAAAVSVVYAYIVEAYIHRDISFADLSDVLAESARLMGALLIIMVMAMAFNDFLVDQRVPDDMAGWLRSQDLGPIAFLLVVNVILILAGGVMDILSAILILVPLLAPVAESLGIKPLHLAIVFIVNLELGYMTPPIGLNLFVTSSVFKKPLGQVVRSVLPTLTIMLVAVLVVTFVPTTQMGLVNLMRGQGFYEPFPSAAAKAPDEEEEEEKEEEEEEEPTTQPASQPAVIRSLSDITDQADEDLDDGGADEADGGQPGPARKPGVIRSLSDITDEADEEIEDDKGKDKPRPPPKAKPKAKPGTVRSLSDITDDADDEIGDE